MTSDVAASLAHSRLPPSLPPSVVLLQKASCTSDGLHPPNAVQWADPMENYVDFAILVEIIFY